MPFNIWKLHCKNVDLTIVVQPDIIINILYIFTPIILRWMFNPFLYAAGDVLLSLQQHFMAWLR